MKNQKLSILLVVLSIFLLNQWNCTPRPIPTPTPAPTPPDLTHPEDLPCALIWYPLHTGYVANNYTHEFTPCYTESIVTVGGIDKRKITACNVPNHKIAKKPARNPFLITEVVKDYFAPEIPVVLPDSLPVVFGRGPRRNDPRYNFGITLSGVELDPAAAEPWAKGTGDMNRYWTYEAMYKDLGLDRSHAHKQPVRSPGSSTTPKYGRYHYHGIPVKYLQTLKITGKEMVQVGWAADGYPIFYKYGQTTKGGPIIEFESGYELKSGPRTEHQGTNPGTTGPCGVHNGKFVQDWEYIKGKSLLDGCNGIDGYAPGFGNTYYYVITDQFPFIPRCFHAQPDGSFEI